MTSRRHFIVLTVGVLLVVASRPAIAQVARAYTVEDLGSFGGQDLVGLAVNDLGEGAGYGYLADGVMRDLRTSERLIVRINAITDNGQMTGFLLGATTSFQAHAFRTLTDGTLQDLRNTVYAPARKPLTSRVRSLVGRLAAHSRTPTLTG